MRLATVVDEPRHRGAHLAVTASAVAKESGLAEALAPARSSSG
jgi:hypothetical protein